MYDVIIIGGGPAGLTSAVYCISKRLETLLIAPDLGGKANYRMNLAGLEGFEHINGEEIVAKFRNQLEYLDYAVMTDVAIEVKAQPRGDHEVFHVRTEKGREATGRVLILATGVQPKTLQIADEGIYLGRGLSYSAVSHAQLFWGRETAVIGADESALKSAAALANIARRVVVVAPEPLPEAPLKRKIASLANVTLLERHQLVGVHGNGYLKSVTIRDPRGQEQEVDVTGVFVELGVTPRSKLVDGLVDLNKSSHVIIDDRCRTSRPGIFAAGDVTSTYGEQVLIAIGEGAKAALAAHDYLLGLPT